MPDCLKDSKIVQDYGSDISKIEAILDEDVDVSELKEIKKASSLIEVSNIKKELDIEVLEEIFKEIENRVQRNEMILKAHNMGYSQHQIAKILKLSQPTVNRIIKRYKM